MFNYFVEMKKNKSVKSVTVYMKSGLEKSYPLNQLEMLLDKERKFVIFKGNINTEIIDTNQIERIIYF